MPEKEIITFCPASRQSWREWLMENHHNEATVWLIYYKSKSGVPTLSWSDAVEEALCFGWIDSTRKTLDDEKFLQLFSKRKPRSTWSKVNKEKVERLIEEGLMTEAGLKCIAIAKENGSWDILNDVDALIIPNDLLEALNTQPEAMNYYEKLSKSDKKLILYRMVSAKREETRQKRIQQILDWAFKDIKPQIF